MHRPRQPLSDVRERGDRDANAEVGALRAEVEATCDRLGRTWSELVARLKPAVLARDLLLAARSTADDGGRPLLLRVGRTVRARPLPVLLIGTGAILWGVARKNDRASRLGAERVEGCAADASVGEEAEPEEPSPGKRLVRPLSRGAHEVEETFDALRHDARRAGDEVREEAEDVVKKARKIGSAAVNRISGLAEDAGSKAREIRHKAAGVAADAKTRAVVAASTGKRKARVGYERHPLGTGLVVLGAGLALGLLLPATRKEDELLGEASDRLKRKVTGTGDRLRRAGTEVSRATASDDTDADSYGAP